MISVSDMMDHFCVSREMVMEVLGIALERGARYADLYFEHEVSNQLGLTDEEVDNAQQSVEAGVGVRVVVGDRTGYAYTEDVTLEAMRRAARAANRIATGECNSRAVELDELKIKHNRYPIVDGWERHTLGDRIPYLKRLRARVLELDSRVQRVRATEMDGTSHILFANSEGEMFADIIPIGMLTVSCVMEQDGVRESGNASRSFHQDFGFLTEAMIEEMAQEVVMRTAILFDAVKPEGGEMPVVMGAGGSGILLHEAIGHAFEADFIRKGTSIFTNSLGEMICNPLINVVDDGTIPFNRGAVNFDDEGVEGQKTYLVTEGRLTSFLHDRISAWHYGVNPTGNGRRESFRYAPVPRMRATYMEAGPHSEEEMIASVKQGVYVDVFSNGQVQIGAGDFSFYVRSGWLIEDGRLARPIKDINVMGNGPQALADITMVGDNPLIDNGTWTCGKDGQRCAVSCGMPSVLVSRLTVGGE